MKTININGKYYTLLSLQGGFVHCGQLFDLGNDSILSGLIYELGSWYYPPDWISLSVNFIRHIKRVISNLISYAKQ